METADVRGLSRSLAAVGVAKADVRQAVAGYARAAYLADAAQTRKLSPARWDAVVKVLGKDLPAEDRASWVAGLRRAYAAGDQAVGALSFAEMRDLMGVLGALGDGDAKALASTWTLRGESWASLKAVNIQTLAKLLIAHGQPGAAARSALASHLATGWLQKADATQSLAIEQWAALQRGLAKDMPAATRAAWATGLRSGFAGTGAQLARLKIRPLNSLIAALSALGDEGARQLLATWIDVPSNVASLGVDELARATGPLAALGSSWPARRAMLRQHVAGAYLDDPVTIKSGSASAWAQLVRALAVTLPAEQRKVWATGLRNAFLVPDSALAGLRFREFRTLVAAIESLLPHATSVWTVRWVGCSASWRDLSVQELCQLAARLQDAGSAGEEALTQVAAFVTERYVSGRPGAEKASLAEWTMLVERFRSILPPEGRRAIAVGLRTAFVGSEERLTALNANECLDLVRTLGRLGDRETSVVAAAWLAGTEVAGADPEATIELVLLARRVDAKAGQRALADLEAGLVAARGTAPEKCRAYAEYARQWFLRGGVRKCAEWALRAYQVGLGSGAARAQADQGTVSLVCVALIEGELIGKDKGYVGVAQVVGRLAREDKLANRRLEKFKWLADALGTQESRAILEADLLDASDLPRVQVAKVLAWCHKNAGQFDVWRQHVDGQVAGSGGGDKRALWLVVKAVTAAIADDAVNVRAGKPALVEALLANASPAVRMTVLRELVDYYREIDRPGPGARMLASVAEQFQGVHREQVRAWVTQMETAASAKEAARAAALSSKSLLEGRLQYMRRMLAKFQARGDQAKVEEIQAKIAAITAEAVQ